MITGKPLPWLLFSSLLGTVLLAASCGKTMDNNFIINGSPEILKQLKVNVLYLDNVSSPLSTYYNKGIFHKHQGAAEGYVLYVNYNDVLFFRTYSDRNPEYFEYSAKKSITIEQFDNKFHVNVIFLRDQEGQAKVYDSSTQMHTLEDAMVKYSNDFHPATWREQLSLESKLKLTSSH